MSKMDKITTKSERRTVVKKTITIAGNSLARYAIVCTEAEEAAIELQKYLELATGVKLPLLHEEEQWAHEIRVGAVAERKRGELPEPLKEEGYAVEVSDGHLSIYGGSAEADCTAVYEFLDRYVGWRFVAAGVDYLSRRCGQEIALEEGLSYSYNPAFEYRKVDWVCSQNEDFQRKNAINFEKFHWTDFVHTLGAATGVSEREQPCLSDPEMLRRTIAWVRRRLTENPECRIISVSQNDNSKHCTCEKCMAVAAEEESNAGPLIRFVNAVADDIKDDYPNVAIETLAYVYSRKAPKITRPRENVIIRLCPIACCLSHKYGESGCPENETFPQDTEDWSKICNRLYVWDYGTNYHYYLAPFPNFRVMLPNMRFFAEHHVVGMYPQGNFNSESGEFGELRAYLLARCMWNPYMSEEEYSDRMNDFLEGYYGPGWENIRAFIDFTLEASLGRHFTLYRTPFIIISRKNYNDRLEEIDRWWEEAELRAETQEQKKRVRKSKLQWTFIRLSLYPDREKEMELVETCRGMGIKFCESDPERIRFDYNWEPAEWYGN